MATFSDCYSCATGDHSGHVEHWGKRAEGIIDGDFCRCIGDCSDRAENAFSALLGTLTTATLSPEAKVLLAGIDSSDPLIRNAAVQRINDLMDADPLPSNRSGKSDS